MNVREELFIGGRWSAPATTDVFDVICPSTEAVVGRVPAGSSEDIDRAVIAARSAFETGQWSRRSPHERAAVLSELARRLAAREGEFAELITTEMGAPITSSLADQVRQPITTIDYYVDLAAAYPFEEQRSVGRPTTVVHEPVGVVAAIVPWNAPLRSIVNKLVPALLAGCSVVVKPAPTTPLSAFALADILVGLDLPDGVVSIIPAHRAAGAHLASHPGVDKVAFTGSTVVGRQIMRAAAANLTRVGLELGGKSAAIVLDDADVEAIARRLVPLAISNTGQACTAMTRVLVSRRRHDDVVDVLCDAMAAWAPGDPFDASTRTGPLASIAQLARVLGYLELAAAGGAKPAIGGGRAGGFDRGYFVEPTVLTGVSNDMRIAREEVFGPVVSVIPYDDVDGAVAIANDSEYGLSGSVWTSDEELGRSIARRVRTGQVRVNGAAVAADAPFGGFKSSGIGREYGPEGLASFLETKAIASRR